MPAGEGLRDQRAVDLRLRARAVRNRSRSRESASQTRWRMNQAVARHTPTLAAVSRSVMAAAMQAAKACHFAAGSFEPARSPMVLAVKVRPQPRQRYLWAPPASRPLRTNLSQPHLGQREGSPPPAPSATSRAIASRIASAAPSSSPREAPSGIAGTMRPMPGPFRLDCLATPMVRGRADIKWPRLMSGVV